MPSDSSIDAIRADYAEEEAEAAEAELAERAAALDTTLTLRVSRALEDALRRRAEQQQIPVSALCRRLLTSALEREPAALDARTVEAIARRVVREELAARA
jgi:predicted HicB family RNase H-like nuclease